jgi:hypothetical protein
VRTHAIGVPVRPDAHLRRRIVLLLPLGLPRRLAAVGIAVPMARWRTTEQKEEQEEEEGVRATAAPTMGTVLETRRKRRRKRRRKTRSGGR